MEALNEEVESAHLWYAGADPVIYYLAGLCKYYMGHIAEAVELLQASLSYDPSSEECATRLETVEDLLVRISCRLFHARTLPTVAVSGRRRWWRWRWRWRWRRVVYVCQGERG